MGGDQKKANLERGIEKAMKKIEESAALRRSGEHTHL